MFQSLMAGYLAGVRILPVPPVRAQRFLDLLALKLNGLYPDQDVEELRLESISGLQHPQEMTKPVYLALQAIAESIEAGAARGEEHACDKEYGDFVDGLMTSSPWALHPDFGCITKELAEIRNDYRWAGFTGNTSVSLSPEEMAAILATDSPVFSSLRERVAKLGAVSDEDRDVFVMAAWGGRDGDLEFDTNAVISSAEDNGAYVAAFKWVDFSGTHLDKEAEEDDAPAAERPSP